ncbi:hypothetical protein GLAREA_12522 [Glarea lozoyensis ATCC 20868]|uniref:Uncharacterized protein n=1 Tax=Glarea lozoyensis (strain ATCC 20868 / MF5171) TaxID=1116229 RepID=S3D241_GLAL2|nr:uncharacterized protein GLAREA_12522 [Glarea lozoyensis ATCC 20868]EPE31219.1 hypothetical protein GLAREA_12522 [Glarea lozoyensis ATCC 20868]
MRAFSFSTMVKHSQEQETAKDQSTIVTVIVCVLFSYFESLRGQLAHAITHLRSTLDVLSSHATITASTALLSIPHILTRVGFQANYFVDNTHHARLAGQLRSLCGLNMGPVLGFEESQTSLYSCFNGSMFSGQKENQIDDLVSLGTNYHMAKCAKLILQESDSPRFVRGRDSAINNLMEWKMVFDKHLSTPDEAQTDINKQAITLLQLHHLVATMMLSPDFTRYTGQTILEKDANNFE